MSGRYAHVPRVVAEILAGAAVAEAIRLGIPMAVAVVEAEGGAQVFTRMDGTLPVSSELAVSKAYTAAILRMTSATVGTLAQPGAALYGIESTHNGRIVLFGGGLPLCLGGEVAGAIGVSGGSVEEDVTVATPAVELLRDMECWADTLRGLLPGVTVAALTLERLADELTKAVQASPEISPGRIPTLVGAVCLALS